MAGYNVYGGAMPWQPLPTTQGFPAAMNYGQPIYSQPSFGNGMVANLPNRLLPVQQYQPGFNHEQPAFSRAQVEAGLNYIGHSAARQFQYLSKSEQRQRLAQILREMEASANSPTSTQHSPGSYEGESPYGYDGDLEYSRALESPFDSLGSKQRHMCPQPQCRGQTFERRGDLKRHTDSLHNPNAPRFDCPVANCNRVGKNGLPRQDKLYDHIREKHKLPLEKRKRGERRDSMLDDLYEQQRKRQSSF